MANPNPSPETRFKPGNPGGGKTSKQKKLEYEAAEMAAAARHKLLTVITDKLSEMDGDPDADQMAALLFAKSDFLKLFKDSEDRAHGTAKQAVDHTSSDGSMTPKPAIDAGKLSDDAMREILNARTDES